MASASDSDSILAEIAILKQDPALDVKVIENIGDFKYVVQATFKEWGYNVKFQITGDYPSTTPAVIVSGCMDSDAITVELQNFLTSNRGGATVTACLESTKVWLKNHCLVSNGSSPINSRKKQKQKKCKSKAEDENLDDSPQKKASMKTADDVIKRILWDTSLNSGDFSVGYLDRFLGVLEKCFTVFSWEDLASVDYTVLAIPKHRIQYFKYKDVKVWDKTERLDNVFGSVGSGLTIADVVRMYAGENIATGTERINEAPTRHDLGDDDNDDDNDDDGVTITIGSTYKNAANNQHSIDDEVADDNDEEDEDVPGDSWRNRMRPNYFLCQRVTDAEIVDGVAAMQNAISERTSCYDSCFIPPSALHVTLCTLGLDTPQQLQEMIDLLNRSQAELSDLIGEDTRIECTEVNHFFSRVVYSKVKGSKKFHDYVDHLRMLIQESGLSIRDNYAFVPHMTIMKVSRPVARSLGRKTVPAWMYEDFAQMSFGSQLIDGIHLCEMKPDKASDGFYLCPAKISLTK